LSEAPPESAASQDGRASLDRVEITYECDAASLETLAGRLSEALSRPLHRQESPRTGAWYSSHDLASFTRARKAGDVAATRRMEEELRNRPVLVVRRNDAAHGVPAVEASPFLLTTTASAAQLEDLESRLRAAGLAFRERGRAPRPAARAAAESSPPPRRPQRR
jgi:predicted deacetylase